MPKLYFIADQNRFLWENKTTLVESYTKNINLQNKSFTINVINIIKDSKAQITILKQFLKQINL